MWIVFSGWYWGGTILSLKCHNSARWPSNPSSIAMPCFLLLLEKKIVKTAHLLPRTFAGICYCPASKVVTVTSLFCVRTKREGGIKNLLQVKAPDLHWVPRAFELGRCSEATTRQEIWSSRKEAFFGGLIASLYKASDLSDLLIMITGSQEVVKCYFGCSVSWKGRKTCWFIIARK